MGSHLLKQVRSMADRDVHILGHEESRKAAVLIPLRQNNGQLEILFEKRAATLKKQPGDVCFPGGGVEEGDRDPSETAVRETCEELGLDKEEVHLIAPLDVFVTHYHGHIYPFVGLIDEQAAMNPNPEEVDEIFSVPLSHFLTTDPERYDVTLLAQPPDDFPFDRIVRGRKYRFRKSYIPEYFYSYGDYVIWGMTARILLHFVQLLRKNDQQS